MSFRNLFILIFAVLASLPCGCGRSKKPGLNVSPVEGKLTVVGKPTAAVNLRFHAKTPLSDPAGRPLAPSAKTATDGSFAPNTYALGDGLPPGEYAVTAIFPKITFDQGEEIIGPDRWNGKYADPKRPLATITVGTEPLTIPPIDVK